MRVPRRVVLERGSPDVAWVSRLAHVSREEAARSISEVSGDLDFAGSLERTLLGGGRANYIQIAAPFELYALVRLCKPVNLVEVGVAAGVSSAYILKAIQANGRGRLHSIDLPERQGREKPHSRNQISWALPPGKFSGWAVPTGLKAGWDLRLGRSGELLPGLVRELHDVDFFLYDVPYTVESAISDFTAVNSKVSRGVVLADNALIPLRWWAKSRNATLALRRGSGLRGFSVGLG
jgi:Methyltransferase domain